MRGTDWEQNLANISTFIRVRDEVHQAGGPRCRVTLQLTFMEANLPELPEIIDLALTLGIDRVKGHHLWAHFSEIQNLSLKRSADSIRRWNVTAESCRSIAATAQSRRGVPLLLENFESLEC